jgi:flavin reductase (DIM6/NTAB) family NADH-FMN oxidoreductase RutF
MSWIDQHEDMAGAFEAAAAAKSVDARQFREAMSRLGAAVHVVTTDGPAGKSGFTATAIVSVSDKPATLLVCLNRAATSMPVLRENGVFCVNTLRAGDELLADTFAGRTKVARDQRFAVGQWSTLVTRSPVLTGAVVAFDCHVTEVKAVASHDIYFGVVEAIHFGSPGAALVYHDRAYKQV